MGQIEKIENKSRKDMEKELMDVICCLDAYRDSGRTPDEVMDLSEAVKKLDNIFGDNITVNQVIDFFVDYYVAQGDPGRVEAAELLTNEDVTRYMELKERDTAKAPIYQVQGDERYEQDPEWWMCPHCEEVYDMDDGYDFCPNCGQRIKWED